MSSQHQTLICRHCHRVCRPDMARCVCGRSLKGAVNLDLWPEYMQEWMKEAYGRDEGMAP